MVSGCSVLTGSEEEDQESGVAKPFTFRLKLDSNVSSNPAVLCLATDNQESLDQWIHALNHSSQTVNTDQVRFVSLNCGNHNAPETFKMWS